MLAKRDGAETQDIPRHVGRERMSLGGTQEEKSCACDLNPDKDSHRGIEEEQKRRMNEVCGCFLSPLVLLWVNVTRQLKGSMHAAKNRGKAEH